MDDQRLRQRAARMWGVTRRQHGVITRAQLLGLGFRPGAIKHRITKGRLHPLWRGVYVVGRPEVSREGRWMAAVLACGSDALLSHGSAALLWGLVRVASGIDVVVPEGVYRRPRGIVVHRRVGLGLEHRRAIGGIPVTDPVSTLVDLASFGPEWQVERAINEADRLDLVDTEALADAVDSLPGRPGMATLRRLVGRRAFTDSGLERRFLALARRAGLPRPETQEVVSGDRVDFYWPHIGLIVETDGWRYHRTPGEQATDRRRDQGHTMAGLTTLRFAEEQIRTEPKVVEQTLVAVANRLAGDIARLPSSQH